MATTMNISLPDAMKAYVETTIATDGYGTASEYVRELIRADQRRKEQEELEKALLRSLESGSVELSDGLWDQLRTKVSGRLSTPAKPSK